MVTSHIHKYIWESHKFLYIQDVSSANSYLFFPHLVTHHTMHPTFFNFPFLHPSSICLNLDCFLFAGKLRNTASNTPQMLKSGFLLNLLTLHLTTLDERREEMKLSQSAAGCNYGTIHSFKWWLAKRQSRHRESGKLKKAQYHQNPWLPIAIRSYLCINCNVLAVHLFMSVINIFITICASLHHRKFPSGLTSSHSLSLSKCFFLDCKTSAAF